MFEKIRGRLGAIPQGLTPVVLVACGSFSPLHYAHMRMFEIARNALDSSKFFALGGLLSPCNDGYGKPGLASASDRVSMCRLAAASSDWIDVDDWEAHQHGYVRTATLLQSVSDRLRSELRTPLPIEVRLVCGSDLLDSITKPGVWDPPLFPLLFSFGLVCITRNSSDLAAICAKEPLASNMGRIQLVDEEFRWAINSTFLRKELKAGRSVQYLMPDSVIAYIREHRLFLD